MGEEIDRGWESTLTCSPGSPKRRTTGDETVAVVSFMRFSADLICYCDEKFETYAHEEEDSGYEVSPFTSHTILV